MRPSGRAQRLPRARITGKCALRSAALSSAATEFRTPSMARSPDSKGLFGDSLTTLFGMNYYGNNKQTPPLRYYIDAYFPEYNNWNLIIDGAELYKNCIILDEFHKDVLKHFEIRKIEKIQELDFNKVSDFRETTKNMWIWFLNKNYNGVIPDEILKYFR